MIIFLDIDGVLNQLQSGYYIDRQCVKQLAVLVKKTKAEIVLTSTWRMGFLHNRSKCTPQVQKLLAMFDEEGIVVKSRTKNLGDRKTEIEEYIKENSVKKYLVLDDDKKEFPKGTPEHFYLVNARTGLTKSDVEKAWKVFG